MSNTIVLVSDRNYLWGVWMLIVSMRKNGMNEPALVQGEGYTESDIAILKQFADVTVLNRTHGAGRNLCCSKPDIMLLPDTDYVTWADCDAIFFGNCSRYLTADPEHIHVEMRGERDNAGVFAKIYEPNDIHGGIPAKILDVWRKDVGENTEPALRTCCSTCFISIHRSHRDLLEKWRDQIQKVLPDDDTGVCDKRSFAYFQTDESVLNSVLCFSKAGIPPTDNFMLDKDPNAFFIHFAYQPKPWQMWNRYSIKYFDKTVELVEWAVAQGYKTPGPVPVSLQRKYRKLNHLLSHFGKNLVRSRKVLRRLGVIKK